MPTPIKPSIRQRWTRFKLKARKPSSVRERRKAITGMVVTGIKIQKAGREKFGSVFWTGLGGAVVSGIDSIPKFREFLNQDPQTVVQALKQAGVVGFAAAIGSAIVGSAQLVYGKIKIGKNLKKLKPFVWQKPQLAGLIIKRLSAVAEIDSALVQTIKSWGKGIEFDKKTTVTQKETPMLPEEIQKPKPIQTQNGKEDQGIT